MRNRAEYMRAYRAHRKRLAAIDAASTPAQRQQIDAYYADVLPRQAKQIAELEEEVHRLKAELASRPNLGEVTRRPKVDIIGDRKSQQAARDRILRKINRGG